MAKLDKIAESLNIKMPDHIQPPMKNIAEKPNGHKRRDWLIHDEAAPSYSAEPVDNSIQQKGSIDPIHRPRLSTPFINPVDQPLLYKGSIKEVYRPLIIYLESLRGNPLKIAQYIFELSKETNDKTTDKITQSDVMKNLLLSRDSARTAMRFLLKNKLIERVDFKPGKMGWSKYRIENKLFFQIAEAYKKGSITPLKNDGFLLSQKGSNSSSSINNINTTTIRPLLSWEDIDTTPLSDIGFNQKHVLQLKSKNTPDVVQDSIAHFAYALKFNPKLKKYNDPLSVFMGVLRKGEAWVETEYRSPTEIAQLALIERKKSERERLKKLEEEAYQEALLEWSNKLTKEDIERIAPSKKEQGGVVPQDVRLRTYFKDHVWPEVMKNYII